MKLVTTEKTHNGHLAKGCIECILGKKSVLFITGKCHYKCFYCPISDDKRNIDIVKINEFVVKKPDTPEGIQEVIAEINMCSSVGVGITGGDPLADMKRTCMYIKALKKEFGKKFHIHLYTSLPFLTKERLKNLEEAGLDEIRFHIDIDNEPSWETIELVKECGLIIGIEIPVLPGKKDLLEKLLKYIKTTDFIKFVNLNELEYSDISEMTLTEKGYLVKNSLSYGITNSEETAKELVKYGKSIDLAVHYCSASFKDRVQLGNRLRRRAENAALPLDIVDEDGLLTRGEIRLEIIDKKKLEEMASQLQEEFGIPEELLFVEIERLLIAPWILKEMVSEIIDDIETFPWQKDVEISIVKEYPTSDHFLVEKEVLLRK